MRRWLCLAADAVLFLWAIAAPAQELVHFPSLAGTVLDGYLSRAPGEGPRPAVVIMHGCGGMFDRKSGAITQRWRDWAAALNADGYSVLMVDSFSPRGIDVTCSSATSDPVVAEVRPQDAYGALVYLQSQPFVRGDRIGLMGWSAGGGSVLRTIPNQSTGRPA